jgi:protein SCO1/2
MARRPATAPPQANAVRTLDGGFWLVVALAGVLLVALVGRFVLLPGAAAPTWTSPPGAAGGAGAGSAGSDGPGSSSGSSGSAVDLAAYLYPSPVAAPPIELTDPDDRPFSLASLRGEAVLVFFGYTHCPDVCPATTGTVGLAMDAFGPGVRAVFVTIDPERDTTTWLKEYVRYLPAGFIGATGTAAEIKATADAWGARYARVETGVADAYSMAHTAEVYLVDAAGMLRAEFPFGTESEVMTAVLREVAATTGVPAGPVATPSPAPSTAGSAAPAAAMAVELVSSSVWAGNPGPIILDLAAAGSAINDPTLRPTVRLVGASGETVGGAVAAVAVRPPGLAAVSYVATVAIPTPGAWRLQVEATLGGRAFAGSVALTALDPGTTAALGAPAPGIRTPTLDDVGGVARAITTDPAPDLRLSRRSTADALADGQPFVLVVDSTRFKVSPACGRAIIMARYLLDRWREVGFIHLEPFRYSVITDTAVLEGSLDDPTLTDPAAAWGIGGDPWGPASMPWVFVVDGDGIVRAKYQAIMGSADVDVILALIEQGG